MHLDNTAIPTLKSELQSSLSLGNEGKLTTISFSSISNHSNIPAKNTFWIRPAGDPFVHIRGVSLMEMLYYKAWFALTLEKALHCPWYRAPVSSSINSTLSTFYSRWNSGKSEWKRRSKSCLKSLFEICPLLPIFGPKLSYNLSSTLHQYLFDAPDTNVACQ